MTSEIDKVAAKSAQLKSQVKDIESQVSALAKAQAEMDKIRFETYAEYHHDGVSSQ